MEMQEEVIDILKKTGAVLEGHFVGVSGRHMKVYVNKDAFLPHTEAVSRIGELFAEKNKHLPVDIVVGPAVGGIILSQWTAYHLSKLLGREVLSIYTEKTPESDQVFRRGYDKVVEGKNVLIVEDTTTTGGSVRKVVDKVKVAGGNVLQVTVMTNRDTTSVTEETVGAPFSWLAILAADSYAEEECQLCKANVPVNTNVGHGKKFLEAKGLA